MVTRRTLLSLVLVLITVGSGAVIAGPKDWDRDGMPDNWEQRYGLNISDPADALSDPDRDGFPNLTEYLLNTDPLDEESHPTLADNREIIIAYWPLVTNAVEALSTNLVGQLKNGACFNNSAVKLDGKDDYVNFGNASSLSVTGSISFCLWLKPDQGYGTTRILGKFKTAGNNREYALFAGPDDRLWVFFSDNGSADKGRSILKATGRQVLQDRKWQHLAITWDATNGVDGVSCYVNGKKMPLYDLASSEMNSLYSGQADLTLGAYDTFTAGWGRWQREIVQNSFKGFMAQLILCRGTLSSNEVREIEMLGRQADIRDWLDMDFDQDGMPDWWERKHFGDTGQSADSDFDNDGLNNIREYQVGADPANPDTDGDGFSDGVETDAGTDPNDPASKPQKRFGTVRGILSCADDVQAGVIRIVAVSDPVVWNSSFYAHLPGPGPYLIEEIPVGSNYWLKAWCDYNGNGSNESWEACGEYQVNPLNMTGDVDSVNILIANPDVDNDGMPDWWEVKYGLNPGDPSDAERDMDGDDLDNLSEYQNRTNPLNADSDLDQLSDGLEVNKYHTDPLVADTDGDGLKDGEEVCDRHVVVCWGNNDDGELNVPDGMVDIVAIAGGYNRSMVLDSTGKVMSWGYMDDGPVPAGLTGVVAIASGESHSMALKNDGTVVCWGWNWYGQTNVPDGLMGIVAIAAGWNHSMALKSNGTVVCWGCNELDQASVPNGLTGVVAIAGGGDYSMALRSDGTVVGWGWDEHDYRTAPEGLTGVVAIAGGGWHNMALKSDGNVVCWGVAWDGRTNVPAGLTGVVAIAAGGEHSMALKNDGTVICWGYNSDGQTNVPEGLTGVVAIAGGEYHSMAIGSATSLDPLSRDTDGDGMPDGWEVGNKTDPLVNDALLDYDGDGLSNFEEMQHSTDPRKIDSDDDGMGDAAEILMGFDPVVGNIYVRIPFAEDFDLAKEGDINGWNGWVSTVPGAVVTEATNVHGGQFALELKPSPSAARVLHVVAAMGVERVQESCFIRPVRLPVDQEPETPDHARAVDWYINANGFLVVRDGSTWRTLGDLPMIAETGWIKVVTRQDFTTRKWAIWINGGKYTCDLEFANPVREYTGFSARGSKQESVYIDDITVSQYSQGDPDPDFLADVTNLHVDEMGLGWARIAWTPSISPTAIGYKMRVSKHETKDGDPIEVGELIDLGNVSAVTLTNTPGYYYSVEIHVYDSMGNMTHTTIRKFGQNIGLILSAKFVWADTGGVYLPVETNPSPENPYTFVTGSCIVSSNGMNHFYIARDVDAVGGAGVDDEVWLRVNGGECIKLLKFGETPIIDITPYLTAKDNNLEFTGVDTEGSPINNHPATCCAASDLYVVEVVFPKVDMAMDGNRDDTIDFDNPKDQKYLFWVNDDHDVISGGEEDDQDNTSNGVKDCNRQPNGTITCKRDLEDFARFHIKVDDNVANMSGITYWMKFENGTEDLSINIFKAVGESSAYLSSVSVADQQIQELLILTVNAIEQQLPSQYIKTGNQVSPFIFEGKGIGKGDLTFIVKKDDNEICRKSVSLELHNMPWFYDVFTVGVTSGDRWEVQIPTTATHSQTASYSPATDEKFLLVHGWNMEEWEKARWAETTFKRLWWQGYQGSVAAFNWPTLSDPNFWDLISGFHHFDNSEFRSWLSADALVNVFYTLNSDGKLRVLAHSMGNVVTGEAICRYAGTSLHTYLACQAALSGHYYDNTLAQVLSSPDTPNIMGYFINGATDYPYFVGNAFKVTKRVNYYNRRDWALAYWLDNNSMKPDGLTPYLFGYTGNKTSYQEGVDRFFQGPIGNPSQVFRLATPRDCFTVFSYIAESRSLALGQETNSVFAPWNLEVNMGYDGQHYSHSKEFRSNLSEQWDFWKQVLTDCDFVLSYEQD